MAFLDGTKGDLWPWTWHIFQFFQLWGRSPRKQLAELRWFFVELLSKSKSLKAPNFWTYADSVLKIWASKHAFKISKLNFNATFGDLVRGNEVEFCVTVDFPCKEYKVLPISRQWALLHENPGYNIPSKMHKFILTDLLERAFVAMQGCILATGRPWGKIFEGFPSDTLGNIWCEFKENRRGSGEKMSKNLMIWRGLTLLQTIASYKTYINVHVGCSL